MRQERMESYLVSERAPVWYHDDVITIHAIIKKIGRISVSKIERHGSRH